MSCRRLPFFHYLNVPLFVYGTVHIIIIYYTLNSRTVPARPHSRFPYIYKTENIIYLKYSAGVDRGENGRVDVYYISIIK